jgi:branched-chain amino acid transport system substrate-binding protein
VSVTADNSKQVSRRKFVKYAGAGAVVVAGAAAAAYYGLRSGPAPPQTSTTSAPAPVSTTVSTAASTSEQLESIKLALFHAGSGPCSALGVPWMRAELLAMKHINQKGIQGFTGITYDYYDNESSTSTAKLKAERMLQTAPADFVVFGDCENIDKEEVRAVTPENLATADTATPCMTGSQAGEIIYGDVNLSHWYFVHDCTNIDQGLAGGQLMAKLGAKKVAFIAADYDYGYLIYAGLNAYSDQNGKPYEIGPTLFTPLDKTDYSAEIAKIKAANVDGLVCVFTGAGFLSLPKQLTIANAKPKNVYFSGDWGGYGEASAAGVEGMTGGYVLVPTEDTTSSDWRGFVSEWRSEYGQESYPSLWTEGAYQAVWAIKSAFEKAGTKDKATVKETLRQLKWDGESGAFHPACSPTGPYTEWGKNISLTQRIVQWVADADPALMPSFDLHQEEIDTYTMKYTLPEYKDLARKYVPPDVTW